ncbi:DUF2202 domain-containing protein [Flagellimonas aequoris]|uniref:DUF2202 domain-containing protein n=1 Tax=Flagellimonas aequoris TaxID=2306997 RepID=A0A418NBT5_9FLAO|nr:DUF2202 domain-containing protein [Allomuricauda aequoris]RIV73217.1 DUF2202 domain-containing protein [Allomuricauda aequoris]TXK07030.1 DUF2202 domain-containing protein [Allomuricauda aequoris]
MKVKVKEFSWVVLSILISIPMFWGCSDNGDSVVENAIIDDEATAIISEEDKNALLFMLEEEKLARDTYAFLYDTWGMVQFNNIKQSEELHMTAVVTLLDAFNVDYEILPNGEFDNNDLQALYNKFEEDGVMDEVSALKIGATIEDLDIVDLEEHIQATTNSDIASVFASLQCGSRNHLRSFTQSLENIGSSYEPQFLTVEEYQSILDDSHEQCN